MFIEVICRGVGVADRPRLIPVSKIVVVDKTPNGKACIEWGDFEPLHVISETIDDYLDIVQRIAAATGAKVIEQKAPDLVPPQVDTSKSGT